MRISSWRPAGAALAALSAGFVAPVPASADEPPNVAIQASTEFAIVGAPVTFIARGRDPDGVIVRREWDVDDDGVFAEHVGQRRFTRAFWVARCVTVRLKVTDNGGNVSQAVVGLTVFPAGQLPTPCQAPPPPPPPFVNSPPRSVFSFAPAAPRAGDPVDFVSGSTDPDGPVTGHAWDLDGDGAFNDAEGPTARFTYPTAGPRIVSLRVVDDAGVPAVASQIVAVQAAEPGLTVQPPAPQQPQPQPPDPGNGVLGERRRQRTPLLTPVTVRIRGEARGSRVRVERLSVQAPNGSTITVRCSGRGCPAVETSSRSRSSRREVRFKRFERSLLVGTVIRIMVTRAGRIGKYTRFALVRDAAPARADLCLRYGRTKPFRCPDDVA